ncbi:hypothetical protein ACLB1T_01980 [Escherichia coli]
MDYLANGIPERPARFIKALQNYYHTPNLRRNSSRGRKRSTKASATFYNEERR